MIETVSILYEGDECILDQATVEAEGEKQTLSFLGTGLAGGNGFRLFYVLCREWRAVEIKTKKNAEDVDERGRSRNSGEQRKVRREQKRAGLGSMVFAVTAG